MINTIRNWVVAIILTIGIFATILLVFSNVIPEPGFEYSNYQVKQKEFVECEKDYQSLHQKAQNFEIENYIIETVIETQKHYQQFQFETSCNTDHVINSKEQLKEIALIAHTEVKDYFSKDDAGLLDTVYTANQNYYAFYGTPQSYLFYGMTKDQKQLVAVILEYDLELQKYQAKTLWSEQDSKDLKKIEVYTQNLLLKYNEKVF